jgi:hypothetical protein
VQPRPRSEEGGIVTEACPRCRGYLDQSGEFANCVVCGHEGYDVPARKRLMPTVIAEMLRPGITSLPYTGEVGRLRHRLVTLVAASERRKRPTMVRTCPFDDCQYGMYTYNGQGLGRVDMGKLERTFRCANAHSIQVRLTATTGGWR